VDRPGDLRLPSLLFLVSALMKLVGGEQ